MTVRLKLACNVTVANQFTEGLMHTAAYTSLQFYLEDGSFDECFVVYYSSIWNVLTSWTSDDVCRDNGAMLLTSTLVSWL